MANLTIQVIFDVGIKNFTALAKSIQKVYLFVVKLVLFGENQGKISTLILAKC